MRIPAHQGWGNSTLKYASRRNHTTRRDRALSASSTMVLSQLRKVMATKNQKATTRQRLMKIGVLLAVALLIPGLGAATSYISSSVTPAITANTTNVAGLACAWYATN